MIGRTNTGGGGGGGLNFKVIPNPMPSTAKENTIWVDANKINNYYFSAEQPENMVDYDVWFPIGTSSTVAFSATKKNPIMVYPLSAKQYVGGAWVNVVAKSYQNGEWVDWLTYLYKAGNEYADITGGWQFVSTRGGCTLGVYTNNGDSITLNGSSSAMQSTSYCTKNPIDLTGVTKLWINVTKVSGQHIWFKAGTTVSMANGASRSSNLLTGHNYIEVNNLNGLHYVAIEVYSDKSVNGSVTFDAIWKE